MKTSRCVPVLSGTLAALLLLSSCSTTTAGTQTAEPAAQTAAEPAEDITSETMELTEEEVPLAEAPISTMLLPEASGTKTQKNQKAVIDYSNTSDGYVMVKYTASTTKRLKVLVKGPTTTYTYNLQADNAWDTYPLSDGNGSYTISAYEKVSGTKYAGVLSQTSRTSLPPSCGRTSMSTMKTPPTPWPWPLP